jgi:hypothetical protein
MTKFMATININKSVDNPQMFVFAIEQPFPHPVLLSFQQLPAVAT